MLPKEFTINIPMKLFGNEDFTTTSFAISTTTKILSNTFTKILCVGNMINCIEINYVRFNIFIKIYILL